ncbi:hypothetical protein [Teredinibacter purpureus]|uniref:hypothetical protein n=1 Tax=Teredinibacter purpureus TaxID=2731756 RepID=UPI0013C4C1FD|nr:hypothetical protein [Teredinibacter purpureus]
MRIFSLAVFLLLSSCSISNKTAYEDVEGLLPDNFFVDIRHNKTSQLWIESQLGEPQSRQQGPDNQSISNYRLYRLNKMHADLFVLLRYDGEEQDVEYFHVFYDEGVVKSHWRDRYAKAQSTTFFRQPNGSNEIVDNVENVERLENLEITEKPKELDSAMLPSSPSVAPHSSVTPHFMAPPTGPIPVPTPTPEPDHSRGSAIAPQPIIGSGGTRL